MVAGHLYHPQRLSPVGIAFPPLTFAVVADDASAVIDHGVHADVVIGMRDRSGRTRHVQESAALHMRTQSLAFANLGLESLRVRERLFLTTPTRGDAPETVHSPELADTVPKRSHRECELYHLITLADSGDPGVNLGLDKACT